MQIRVAVVSAVPTQIKATVAAYVVQKDTVANLAAWHPANHVVTESLSGAIVTQTIVCNGPHKQFQEHTPNKHQGVGEFIFQGTRPSDMFHYFLAYSSLRALVVLSLYFPAKDGAWKLREMLNFVV
jgi:hypothetical protein